MSKQKILYIALLRGINVGGKNSIKMLDLKTCFTSMGLTDVVTYIQSGNVLFTTSRSDQKKLMNTIEATLLKQFGYTIPIVLISYAQLKEAVASAPRGFGKTPATHRYDVLFLKQPLTAEEALKSISIREGVDHVSAGENVLYFSRLTAKATQSRLSRIVRLPIYKNMTIRNWNTTTKLLALAEKDVS